MSALPIGQAYAAGGTMEGHTMTDVDAILDAAGLSNQAVRDYVKHWFEVTGAAHVEVVNAVDDARLFAVLRQGHRPRRGADHRRHRRRA